MQDSAQAELMNVSINGETKMLDAASFGEFIKDNYDILSFEWQNEFMEYKDTHIMRDVLNTLMDGMDDVSRFYISHHEALLGATPLGDQVLLHNGLLWNDIDLKLMARYEELTASGEHPILSMVNQEWGTGITNFYGFYDTPIDILQQVNGKDILDVGAFVGDSAAIFRSLFPQSTIHAFEPCAEHISKMRQHFTMDIESGIIVPVAKACSDKAKTLTLYKEQDDVDARASTYFKYKNASTSKVEALCLNDYAKEHKLKVGLLKIDVQGGELDVINGALELIKKDKPLLAIAIYNTPEAFYELKPYLLKKGLKYEFRVRRASIQSPLKKLVLIGIPQ